jgi:hypothetical protein
VADFRPLAQAGTKIPRADGLNLRLEPTTDILAEAARVARAGGAEPEPWPQLSKAEVADRLLDRVLATRT